ncbi:MAG TPA: OmpA family protein [Xanthobacteraceae bacterium]|nr:OmpA family protein [Xanthobacteraceae bacterium]
MRRNSLLFSTAILFVMASPPLSLPAAAEGIRLAQAAVPADDKDKRPPGQRPAQGAPAQGAPGQHPPAANAPPGRPAPPTAQPVPQQQQQRPGAPPAAAQTPPGQAPHVAPPAQAQTPPGQSPHAAPPATAQTPPAQQPPRPGAPAVQQPAPPPAAAQAPPGQQPQRPGAPAAQQPIPPPATAQTPPGQPPARPGAPTAQQPVPPPAAAQTPPSQPPRPGAPAAQQNAPPPPAAAQTPPGQQLPRPGAPAAQQLPPAGGAPSPALAAPAPAAPTPALANTPVDPHAMPQRLDQLRNERRETREGNTIVIQEANRTIIREGGHDIIRHNEADRFRFNAREVNVERHGNNTVTVVVRPDGARIFTEVDESGRLLRRVRRDAAGREIVLIDNSFEPHGPGYAGFFVELPAPVVRIPREVYIRETARANAEDIYLTLVAPPVDRIERRYALDEIRYSEPLRARMPRVDIDTVNFETGSWEITPDQADRLAFVAQGISRAIQRNPREMFLVEGYTDAVGADVDNLSLSDRRAESVAVMLTNQFSVPAENLTTQGYGKQFLKVPTDGPERANRRVAVRRITPLLMGQN